MTAMPLESLSVKERKPYTKAPLSTLSPTRSASMLTEVTMMVALPNPSRNAARYTTFAVWWSSLCRTTEELSTSSAPSVNVPLCSHGARCVSAACGRPCVGGKSAPYFLRSSLFTRLMTRVATKLGAWAARR